MFCLHNFFCNTSSFKKYVRRGGVRGSLKTERKRTGEGGQAYLYVRSVKKITWFFIQETEFFLISCLAVAKRCSVSSLFQHIKVFFLLKRRRHFFYLAFFVNMEIFSLSLYILLCKKHWSFMLNLQKKIIISLFTPWLFIRKFISVAELVLRGKRVTY